MGFYIYIVTNLHHYVIWFSDGVVDEVGSSVVFEAHRRLFIGSWDEVHVALLIEWEASRGDGVWCLVGVVSVGGGSDEWVLSWVEAFLLYFLCNFPQASQHFCVRS